MAERSNPPSAQPTPPELLRAALEKIVFFEWRLSELASELSAAQARCASAELERARADEAARAAQAQAQAARIRIAELEADRARLASLLARPAHPLAAPAPERDSAREEELAAELEEARRELAMQKAERARWLNEMIEQARNGDEAPAALAQFISELRGDVIALRARQQQSDALLRAAGIEPPPAADPPAPPPAPHHEAEPVEAARKMWAEGRLAPPQPARTDVFGDRQPPPAFTPAAEPAQPAQTVLESSPARALADQCLRALSSRDPARREQAARHLAALPSPAAAPLLASALGTEHEPRARAWLARALAACGGDGACALIERLQDPSEPPLVRLAALEALAGPGGPRALAALERASTDSTPAVRRRAAALAVSVEGAGSVATRLAADEDPSVRRMQEPSLLAPASPAEAEPPARDVAQEALLAVQAAMFGLTDGELAETLHLPEPEAFEIAARLVSAGRLGRRGKRLIAAQGA